MTCVEFAPNSWLCRGPRMEEVTRKPHDDVRWCFVCRKRVAFEFVVMSPVEPSYYGPTPSIECVHGHQNGDLFPGGYREWSE